MENDFFLHFNENLTAHSLGENKSESVIENYI